MMALIFLLLTVVVLLIWLGHRTPALMTLILTLVLSTGLFIHHMGTHLNLSL